MTLFLEWLDDLIFDDPQAGLKWAKVAPDLALAVPEEAEPLGAQARQERLVKAWVILGGAFRACGRPDEAEAPYREAHKLIKSETISKKVSADAERRFSYHTACQGLHDEAFTLAAGAVATLRKEEGADKELARALVSEGYALILLGRHSKGIDAFGEALILAGDSQSPANKRLHAAACNNLAYAISVSASFSDHRMALLYTQQARKLLRGQKTRIVGRYHLLWIEGLIWSKTGSHAKAERLFRQALKGFEALKLPWHVALVGLDLAALLHLCGDLAKLEKIARETYQQFRVLSGAGTQTLAALSLWVDAVRTRSWVATEDEDDEGKALRKYHGLQEGARRVILAGVVTGQCCKTDRKRHP